MIRYSLLLASITLTLAACGPAIELAPIIEPSPEEPAPAPEPEPEEPKAEPAPETLGTPTSSRDAAPKWWMKWPRIKQLPEYAPQADSPWKLYEAARDAGGQAERIQDALLACEVKVGEFFEKKGVQLLRPGAFSRADLQIMARVEPAAGEPGLFSTARGDEDTNEMTFTVPLARMKKGDVLALLLVDRDLVKRKGIERLGLTFDGTLPLRATGKKATAECRLLDRDALEKRMASRLEKLDGKLDKLDQKHRPSMSGRNLGRDRGEQFIYHEVGYAAALVGWDDPRVARRVARLDTLVKRFDDDLKKLVGRTRAAAAAPGEWTAFLDGEVEARQVKKLCGAKKVKPYRRLLSLDKERKALSKSGCVYHVRWKNAAAPGPITLSTFNHRLGGRLEDFELIAADGGLDDAKILGVAAGRKGQVRAPKQDPVLAPGAEVEVAYLAPSDGQYLLQGKHEQRRLRLGRGGWTTLDRGRLQLKLESLICGAELKKKQAKYVYPMPGTNFVDKLGCVVQARVKNAGEEPLLVQEDPALGGIKKLSLITGKPVSIGLEPYAYLVGEKVEKLPEDQGFKRRLPVAPGAEAVIFLAPDDDLLAAGVKADTPALLLRAIFKPRRVDHLRLE